MNVVAPSSRNWSAYLELKFQAGEGKTSLVPIKRYGPLSVQRPFYPEHDLCHTYLLHPPGGVVGGDCLDLKLHNEPDSNSLVTTPGATKFYLSAGQTATVNQHLLTEENATVEFLPQENIYFPGAQVNMNTQLELAADARALYWEKHCFGRPANKEDFATGQVKSRLDIICDDELQFTETQRIDLDEINRASGLRGLPVMGTFVVVGKQQDNSVLADCREMQLDEGIAGITQLNETLIIVRYMGNSTLAMNDYFTRLWAKLRPSTLGRDACHPRIWNT